jgi:RNA polymerase sigma-70 factor (ECF subfamily)
MTTQYQQKDLAHEATNDAFTTLVLTHQPRLLRFCIKRTGNYSDGCDLMQETFRKAYEAYKRDPEPFSQPVDQTRAFLIVIAKRVHINNVRDAVNRAIKIQPFSWSVQRQEQINQCNLCNPTEERIDLEVIAQHIDSLPDVYRNVYIRNVLGDEPLEIAESMGVPPGTIKSSLSRARQILHSKLTNTRINLK